MSRLAKYLRDRLFKNQVAPYWTFEREVESHLRSESTILEIGCGRTAPTAVKFNGRRRSLIGIDRVDLRRAAVPESIQLIKADASRLPMRAGVIDVAYSQSVFEHLEDPAGTIRELFRVLKPGGRLIVLTPNKWDYVSIIARIVPNRFHGQVVKLVEGRAPEDVFPTKYRFNSKADIERICGRSGFQIETFDYLSEYPTYFVFNGLLFFVASIYHKIVDRFRGLRYLKGWILLTLRHE